MANNKFIDNVLIKLNRQYGKDELIQSLNNQIKELENYKEKYHQQKRENRTLKSRIKYLTTLISK